MKKENLIKNRLVGFNFCFIILMDNIDCFLSFFFFFKFSQLWETGSVRGCQAVGRSDNYLLKGNLEIQKVIAL